MLDVDERTRGEWKRYRSFLQELAIYPERNEDVWETLEQDDINKPNKRQSIRREGLRLVAALTISTKWYIIEDTFWEKEKLNPINREIKEFIY